MSAPERPRSTAEEPWPVRTVSAKISGWIAKLGDVWVEGQVAQLTVRPGAATAYLTLRDPAADISLSVTCPVRVLSGLRPPLTEGVRVVVHARPDFYPARGSLSLRATEIRPVGVGELLARLERLKGVLAAEGLFAPERKRPLPFLPRTVGLITGRASAAERDVCENARARWPAVDFRIRAVAVQGSSAAAGVREALAALERDPEVEVIIIARGGGSVEDLLPFSDEGLCRAVAACRTPVISAIGHEVDTPLLDLVADVRASTPTDAGKRVVPDVGDELARLEVARGRLLRAVTSRLSAEARLLQTLRSRPVLANPTVLVDQRREGVLGLRDRTRRVLGHELTAAAADLAHTRARVLALSPAATLERGYAVVQRDDDGAVVRAPADVRSGDGLRLRVAGGELSAQAD